MRGVGENENQPQTAVVARRGEGITLPTLCLTVVEGPDKGASVSQARTIVRIGSAVDNDLVLSDSGVSRHHAEIHNAPEGIVVKDLGSTNGTSIDGVRIREAFLTGGSLIRLGSSAVRAATAEELVSVPVSNREHFGRLLGKSLSMRQVFAILERAAPTDATILIEGETGTGKELTAEAIHDKSARHDGVFVVVDCATTTEGSVEGGIEEAEGGTLFLDEIGEMPLELQPKLLRALETREARLAGVSRPAPIDVRVVATTHRDLAVEVNRGRFREDLFFRLAVVRVSLPPLRSRREDIPLLVQHFFRSLAPTAPFPSNEMLSVLSARDWPGNVRELRNAVERALALARAPGTVSVAPSGPGASLAAVFEPLLNQPMKEASDRLIDLFQRTYIERALGASGSITAAAKTASMSRRQLQRIMQRLGMRDDFDDIDE